MAREYSIKEFKRETIHFCDGVDLSVEMGYSNGQPICKTDSVVLDYLGKKYYATRDASSDESIYEILIMHSIRPIYVVELINHLDRNNNDSNRFEVYHNEVSDKHPEDLDVYVFGNIMDVVRGRAPSNQNQAKSDSEILYLRYNECYDIEQRKFNKDILIKHINPKFEYVYRDYNFTHVPTYGYVNKSGKASKTAQPIMHLAIITNILAHQDKFALINNQEAVASFNSIMKSKRLNTTVEIVTNADTTDEVRLLKSMLADKTQECVTLTDKLDKALEKLDIANDQLTKANSKINDLSKDNEITHNKLDTANKKIDDLVDSHKSLKDAIIASTVEITGYVQKNIPASHITSGTTNEILYVFFNQEYDQYIRDIVDSLYKDDDKKIRSDEIVLDTICCQEDDLEKNLKKHLESEKDIFYGTINNSLDLFKHFSKNVDDVARCLNIKQIANRKIIVNKDKVDELKAKLKQYSECNKIVQSSLVNMIVKHDQVLVDHITNKLGEVNEKLDTIIHNQETLLDLCDRLHPNAISVYYNHYHRDLLKRDGKVFCEIRKGCKDLHQLTENEIKKLSFR